MDVLCTFKIKIEVKILTETSDHNQIKIRIPNPRKEPTVSSKAPNQDFQDILVLCIFKIKVASQNLEQGTTKTIDYIQINVKMLNSNQEDLGSSEAPNQDLK